MKPITMKNIPDGFPQNMIQYLMTEEEERKHKEMMNNPNLTICYDWPDEESFMNSSARFNQQKISI